MFGSHVALKTLVIPCTNLLILPCSISIICFFMSLPLPSVPTLIYSIPPIFHPLILPAHHHLSVFFFCFFLNPTALSPHPLIVVLCLHVFGDVFHSVHCLLQVCVPLNSQTLPVFWEPTTPIWQVARLPAERLCQVLVHVERFGVLWNPTESDVGVLPLVCAGLGAAFPHVTLVGVLPAEFVADIGGAWTPHEEEGRQSD